MKLKVVNESMPIGIAEKIQEVTRFPRSFRLTEELFNSGLELIKQNGLYVPFFSYSALLNYPTDKGFILYSRKQRLLGSDAMHLSLSPIFMTISREGFRRIPYLKLESLTLRDYARKKPVYLFLCNDLSEEDITINAFDED